MIPIGTLCVVVGDVNADALGACVTVIGYEHNARCFFNDGKLGTLPTIYGIECESWGAPPNGESWGMPPENLRVIRPPRSASPVTTDTKHDEPAVA